MTYVREPAKTFIGPSVGPRNYVRVRTYTYVDADNRQLDIYTDTMEWRLPENPMPGKFVSSLSASEIRKRDAAEAYATDRAIIKSDAESRGGDDAAYVALDAAYRVGHADARSHPFIWLADAALAVKRWKGWGWVLAPISVLYAYFFLVPLIPQVIGLVMISAVWFVLRGGYLLCRKVWLRMRGARA